MTTNEPLTLEQVFTLATRLPPADKLTLIARLVPQLAQVVSATDEPVTADDLFSELNDLIADAEALGPAIHDSADVISEMRR